MEIKLLKSAIVLCLLGMAACAYQIVIDDRRIDEINKEIELIEKRIENAKRQNY